MLQDIISDSEPVEIIALVEFQGGLFYIAGRTIDEIIPELSTFGDPERDEIRFVFISVRSFAPVSKDWVDTLIQREIHKKNLEMRRLNNLLKNPLE